MSTVSNAQSYSNEWEEIQSVLRKQEADWNKGKIEDYMQGYWKSDSLRFVGKNGIQYGWQKTLDNYKKSYPDTASMGQLSFDFLYHEVTATTCFIIGKWYLKRDKGDLSGHFSLYLKKINGNWVIVADHSS